MAKILGIGECMIELRANGAGLFEQDFAGDVYNFLVYLKRLAPASDVAFMSAVGADSYSDSLRSNCAREGLNTTWLFPVPDCLPGLYMVNTDPAGERSFHYWRSASAARRMMACVDDAVCEALGGFDVVFLSGITLAILGEQGRASLWPLLMLLKSRGATIVFDPNYRGVLWPDRETARQCTLQAYNLCDIALCGFDDERRLFDSHSAVDALERLASHGIGEIVLTDGAKEIHGLCGGERYRFAPQPARRVVDTTSAGDAFNAGYLWARLNGRAAPDAAEFGSALAALVVGFPGAIVPAMAFQNFTSRDLYPFVI